jgi:hypothetical protein
MRRNDRGVHSFKFYLRQIQVLALFLVPVFLYSQSEKIGSGNNKALLFGVSDYAENLLDLQYSDKDANSVYDFLKAYLPESNMLLLTNKDANSGNFYTSAVNFLDSSNFKANDILFFYFSGHGDAIDENNSFLLLHDVVAANDKNNYYATGTIPLKYLKNKISILTHKGVIVYMIVDACRTNEMPGGKTGKMIATTTIMEAKNGERMLFAASPNQESIEGIDFGGGHGLFTYALLRALNGESDVNRDSTITFKEIMRATSSIVEEEIVKYDRVQDPFFCCNEYYYQPVIEKKKKANTAVKTPRIETGAVAFRGTTSGDGISDTTYKSSYLIISSLIRETRTEVENWEKNAEYFFTEKMDEVETYFDELATKSAHAYFEKNALNKINGLYIWLAQDKINRYLANADINRLQQELISFDKAASYIRKVVPFFREEDKKEILFKYKFLLARSLVEKEGKANAQPANRILDSLIAVKPEAAFLFHTKALLCLSEKEFSSQVQKDFLANSSRSIALAPQWSYPYNLRGRYFQLQLSTLKNNNELKKNLTDSAFFYFSKALRNDSVFKGTYLNFAEFLIRENPPGREKVRAEFLKTVSLSKEIGYGDNRDLFFLTKKFKSDSALIKINIQFLKNCIEEKVGAQRQINFDYYIKSFSETAGGTNEEITYLESIPAKDSVTRAIVYYSVFKLLSKTGSNKTKAESYRQKAASMDKNIKKTFRKIKFRDEVLKRAIRARF